MSKAKQVIETYKKFVEEDSDIETEEEELPQNAQALYDRIVTRVQNKSAAKQAAFWKNFSDKQTALIMDKMPSAGPKYVKLMQEIRKEFADMFTVE